MLPSRSRSVSRPMSGPFVRRRPYHLTITPERYPNRIPNWKSAMGCTAVGRRLGPKGRDRPNPAVRMCPLLRVKAGAARQALLAGGSCCGGLRFAPTSLRCSLWGHATNSLRSLRSLRSNRCGESSFGCAPRAPTVSGPAKVSTCFSVPVPMVPDRRRRRKNRDPSLPRNHFLHW